jgi:hypothetical protein
MANVFYYRSSKKTGGRRYRSEKKIKLGLNTRKCSKEPKFTGGGTYEITVKV